MTLDVQIGRVAEGSRKRLRVIERNPPGSAGARAINVSAGPGGQDYVGNNSYDDTSRMDE